MKTLPHVLWLLALLALASAGPGLAAVVEPASQTLCNAIGSDISVTPAAPSAAKPKRAGLSVKPAPTPATGASGSAASRGGGGDALEPRGRWKSFIPGTFK